MRLPLLSPIILISPSIMDQKTNTNSVFIFIFGLILGILVSSFVFITPLASIFIVIVGTALLIAEKIWNKEISREVLFLSLAFLSFGLGALRYSIKDFHEPLIPMSTGIVMSEPEQRENSTRFVLLADNREKVLVNTDLYSSVQYGDQVRVEGKLETPGIIVNENSNRPFDYGKYLSKDDIYYTLNFTKVEVLSGGHGNPIKRALFKIKRSFVGKTKEILAEPYASLLSGLIVSGREAMPKDILEEFRRAGVIHIVVLSGYNITIIAEFMRTVFRSAKFSIIGIVLFVIMTGAEATVVRAALLVLTVFLAKMFRRKFSAPRALLVAAFLMLIQNPKILVFDPSFELSFLATLALIYVVPIVDKYLKWVPEKWGLRTTTATTLATQMTVLPLLVYSIGDFSLVSLPANILILFIIPTTMLMGFVATIIAYVSAVLALPFSYITHLLLAWILGVSHYLGNLPFASIAIPSLSWWLVVLVYLAIIIFVWRLQNSPPHSAN
ncbi:MAG: ComEC/Rec2 family competence protein [bacterium]|nr:ComEC/Rec2 family competence protein [bacterium]